MYLKSIEVHGFKSFANKIVFQFHNGITAIVGPNGSGKSNVGDAVRWVLGEQSAKQLRGASMQDVIFSGTELRKPLGYASVSITLDNSDHQLAIAYDEVTVTRRVYRSGESEYLINGTQVRLKDINELFYDTGVGKEGYSIIGQGQVEKIISGKPEERRELFDEAAGIVKFKRRKYAAQKKLEDEKQNLVRVNDILKELTRQLEPMEKQAATARIYLQKKEELKSYDINLFLTEYEQIAKELEATREKQEVAQAQLEETKTEYEKTKTEYETLAQEIEALAGQLQEKRDGITANQLKKQQMESQIELLKEQINTAHASDAHLKSRITLIDKEQKEKTAQQDEAARQLSELRAQVKEAAGKEKQAVEAAQQLQETITSLEQAVADGKSRIIEILNGRAGVKGRMQRHATMLEQTQIRKAQISQEALRLRSEESEQAERLAEVKKEYDAVTERIRILTEKSEVTNQQLGEVQQKLTDYNHTIEQEQIEYHREASRLESLRNITERYDGYGNSIRRVMEQKERVPGILGVVADIVKVDKAYETAIETALGGSIQNIVTDTEETAKKLIEFLKRNKYGRATFLPLSGISGKGGISSPQALKEPGVIGLASSLVHADDRYAGLLQYLLGKTVVATNIDAAIALARKYRHSLRIVTTDGELLSPGGSMSGGAFRNSGNLLGRRREIEELERQVKHRGDVLKEMQEQIDACRTRRNALRDEIVRQKEDLQKEYIRQNTAKMKWNEIKEKTGNVTEGYEKIRREAGEIEEQIREIKDRQDQEQEALEASEAQEKETEQAVLAHQSELDAKREEERSSMADTEQLHLALASLRQEEQFIHQNMARIRQEQERLSEERSQYTEGIAQAARDVAEKEAQIREIRGTIEAFAGKEQTARDEIEALGKKKDEKNEAHKRKLQAREDLSERISLLDRENFRLNEQIEKMTERQDSQVSYMWEEYTLTFGSAQEFRDPSKTNIPDLKKAITALKSEIRGLGSVNVNAIEDYKELLERHTFLTTQHEDLLKAEEALIRIIAELDEGMRIQFREQFAKIQTEFDKAFKELFGGGHGTLELVEGEDILEAGVRITAQPPGKKLQNMMQLSGGEKSLTAIALLFAIQNLKPSPFCLLDEIEAALDESNVDRYARYLHKLTKNTQFIIITHRRGTMTAADRLYGITMQEKGVSALVSVNLIEDDLDA